jgi:large subunit ribosomal protein L18
MRKQYGKIKNKKIARINRRKLSIRKKIIGTTETPRVCVVKSNKHIVAQIVDDATNKTLFSVQTFGKNGVAGKANKEGAKLVGAAVAAKLKENKITKVVFDRNGRQYTGVVAEVATGIRENGITI